jgi:hypothetical protein
MPKAKCRKLNALGDKSKVKSQNTKMKMKSEE